MIKMNESNRHLLKNDYIHHYIHGGRGIVTLQAPSGKSHTYAFLKPMNESEFPDDVIFVYAIHDKKLFYTGMIEQDVFRVTRHSRFLDDTEIVRGARFIVKMSLNNELARRTPMKLFHEGVCCRCGRNLTSSRSVELGVGPKCRKLICSNGDR